jgi:hypothetical protein
MQIGDPVEVHHRGRLYGRVNSLDPLTVEFEEHRKAISDEANLAEVIAAEAPRSRLIDLKKHEDGSMTTIWSSYVEAVSSSDIEIISEEEFSFRHNIRGMKMRVARIVAGAATPIYARTSQ